MNDISRQENMTKITEILDMEELLEDKVRFRQWQEDAKGLLHINENSKSNDNKNIINNKIDKEKIKKDYERNHAFMNKDELILRLEILDEVLKYLD